MKVLIKSYLNKTPFFGGEEVIDKDIPLNQCTVAKLLKELGIFEDELVLYFVNKKRVKKDHVLVDGDIVELVALLDGG